MTDEDIREVIVEELKSLAPEAGFEGADTNFEIDWDGEPIIRVRARYARRPKDAGLLLDAAHFVRSALLKRGEDRFVFLTNDIAAERTLEPEEVE